MPKTNPADRRALILALARWGPANGSLPGMPGPRRATWERLQQRGLLDRSHPLPHRLPPTITEAGLDALGLPRMVSSAEDALRAIVQSDVLTWRRPALRFRPRLPAISIDSDEPGGDPIVLSSHPLVVGAVSTRSEPLDGELSWMAACEWSQQVGHPLDPGSNDGAWRLVMHDNPEEAKRIAWHEGAWSREPAGGWGELFGSAS
jgi:hypothetical protein